MKQNAIKVALVYALFLMIAVAAVARIVDLQFFDKDIEFENYGKKTTRQDPIMPVRGSILAADGRYLAFSTPEYFIALDCTVAADSVFEANVRPLAEALSKNYRERSADEYVALLRSRRAAGRGYTRLLKQHVGYDQMKAISQYPLLCLGQRKGGLIVEQIDHREYPYDKLQRRPPPHRSGGRLGFHPQGQGRRASHAPDRQGHLDPGRREAGDPGPERPGRADQHRY